MNKSILIILNVLCFTAMVVNSGSANRHLLDINDDINEAANNAQKEIQGFFKRWWGGVCIQDSACLDVVAYCDKNASVDTPLGSVNLGEFAGECRPKWWIWAIVAAIVLFLVGGIVCCICCGICKCLYK